MCKAPIAAWATILHYLAHVRCNKTSLLIFHVVNTPDDFSKLSDTQMSSQAQQRPVWNISTLYVTCKTVRGYIHFWSVQSFCWLSLNYTNDLCQNSVIEILSTGYLVTRFKTFHKSYNPGSSTMEIGWLTIAIISPSLLFLWITLALLIRVIYVLWCHLISPPLEW